MPWRNTTNPYHIWVSEIMLQQTQVSRVVEKYQAFLKLFPTVQQLAGASLVDVLKAWSGLGYNRRAKFLHQAAKIIMQERKGKFPHSLAAWDVLPGIGEHTAGAIMAYAYNEPVVFIETNIRTVFIHEFFGDQENVSDAELLPFIKKALDEKHPREWYWAIMDYGAHLKATTSNPSRKSKHYTVQTKFSGSVRQLRGKVVKQLLVKPHSATTLQKLFSDSRLQAVLDQLAAEHIILKRGSTYRIA